MKGIILAGGTGSRLLPLTRVTNKHLLPVGKLPMIMHSIKKLKKANVTDIMIVTGTEHMGNTVSLLGSGSEFGCNLTYKVQDKPDGIAGALSLCKDFVGKNNVIVLLCDNIFQDSLKAIIKKFKNIDSLSKCLLSIKSVPDPERYGVACLDESGLKIKKIVEKPKKHLSNYCVTGIYVYSPDVFNIIPDLKLSKRGEYEITDVNNFYVKNNSCYYSVLEGWWTDAGTHNSYKLANQLIWDEEESV